MEYHSLIDSDGNYIGKTKYTKGEFIPLPLEEITEDIRFINHKWKCILPKVNDTEKGYIKFNLNLDKLDNLDNALLQLETFCKKNKLESEFIIKEEQFNNFTSEQQKQIIKSIISHGFKDIVLICGTTPQIKCRSFFTYNYNTKRRECNKIYFRKNVNYSFDCEANVIVSKGVDYSLLNDCLENIQKKHDDSQTYINFIIEYMGCNAKCWYCTQHQSKRKLTTYDESLIPSIKKALNRILKLAEKENIKIKFRFMGGELTILNNDIQKELVEIIDKLIEDGHDVLIFSNGIIKDAPLLYTNARYIIHVIDWKNKKLEKKNKINYSIVFTEKDSIEDLERFKELNKNIPIITALNALASQNFFKKFYNKEASHIYKERDKKHRIYLCRTNYRCLALRFLYSSEHYKYYGCGCCGRFIANDNIPTLLTTELNCPKTCINAYTML